MNSKRYYFPYLITALLFAGCSAGSTPEADITETPAVSKTPAVPETPASDTAGRIYDSNDLFTERDMKQSADLSEAETYELESGQTVTITEEGVYLFTGTAENAQIRIEAGKEDKVQIVLDGIKVTNAHDPVIYAASADKVFITATDSENDLTVTGEFTDDGPDAVIFCRNDVTLNGTGTLNIRSSENGITSKDSIRITGGTYNITCSDDDAVEANDSVSIAGGVINILMADDGLHAENDDDDTLGFVYIGGGEINISVSDDCIHGESIVQIDGGNIYAQGREGIESTQVQINGGTLRMETNDDGINAGRKSSAFSPLIEINDGDITIVMGSGDTDAIDSNGDLVIRGGSLDITARSAFDIVGTVTHTGGTVTVNGEKIDTVTK